VRCIEVSLGKVMALIVGLLMLVGLAVPVAAQFYQSSFSSPYFSSPYGMYGLGGLGGLGGMGGLSSFYGPFGPFGMSDLGGLGGLGSSFGYPSYSSYGNPFSSYGYPSSSYYSSPSGSLFNNDLFSNFGSDSPFGDMFGGSLFKAKEYGLPPEENIMNALVGQKLSYNSGYMGIPLQYEIEDSDIGDITGVQYRGADAWKVRVGQQGAYWDVILDEAGDNVLSVTQVQ
jgi:hypothetical protein